MRLANTQEREYPMKIRKSLWFMFVFIVALAFAPQPSFAAANCKNVSGQIVETVIPPNWAPNDPLGRVVGTVTGVLNGSSTAILTSLDPFPPEPFAVLHATTADVFVTKSRDVLLTTGVALFTPIPGQPPGFFTDELTLTVVGGTGKYLGASGTINVVGEAHDLFSANAYFTLEYKGEVCQ
jgi:hypothetical protein